MEPREEENQPLIAPGFIRGTASASSNRSGGSSWAVGSPPPSAFEASGTVGLAPVTGSGATVSPVHTARSADSTSANWAFHAEATDRDYRSPSVSPFASPIAASAVPPYAAPVAAYSNHEAFAFTVNMRGEGAAGVGPAGVGPATGGGAAGRGGEVEDRGSAPWAMARAVERGMSGDPADGLEQPLQSRLAPLESPELRAILHKSASMLRFESIRRRKGSGSDDSLASQQHLLPPGAAGSVGSGRRSLSRADSGGSAGSFGSAGGGGGSGSNSLNVTPESSFHRGDMYSGSMFEAISEVPPSSEAAGEGEGGEGGPDSVYLSDWVINPQASLYQQFQAALLLLAILIGIVEPFNVAFLDTENVFTPVNVFIYCTDAVFLSDVLLSFFVPEFRMGEWKTSLATIAVEYLRGMFWYDMLAALPWDLVLKGVYQPTGTAAVALSAFGLLRLLRLIRLWNVLWDMAVDVRYDYISTSVHKFALLILFAAHWSACVFFLLARVRNFSEDTWVGHCEPDLPLRPPLDAYVTSIYWAMTTLSTTGYGDLSAFTVPERMWAALFMLVNLGLTAYVLGNMTVLLTKADAHTATYRDRLAAINRYMRAHVVPASLQEQVQAHLKLHFDTAEVRDDVLLHCPSSVRTLVKRHVYSRFVNSSYLFAGTSNVFRDQVTTRANVDFFLPHVDLVAAGNSTTELLIIASGQAQVLVRDKDGNEMQWFVLHEGDCVGEIAFLCDLTELWTVRTLSVCRVLSISRDDYRSVARTHPADDRHVIANLLNRARSRAEATARFYPGNSTMAELSLLLKNEVESFRNRLVQETLMNLCYAAKRGDMLECFRLAAGGFDVAAADYDGRTPMHLAAVTGQDKVVQFLLAHGAQVNAKDAFWRTPLQEAVAAGHWSTAEILRSHQGMTQPRNHRKHTCHLACSTTTPTTRRAFHSPFLPPFQSCSNGGELHLRNQGTHLCRLASSSNSHQLARLLEFGADPNSADYDGRTALHVAAAEGHLNVVKVLLQGGASPSVRDRWQRTPMDEARDNNHTVVVATLLRAAASATPTPSPRSPTPHPSAPAAAAPAPAAGSPANTPAAPPPLPPPAAASSSHASPIPPPRALPLSPAAPPAVASAVAPSSPTAPSPPTTASPLARSPIPSGTAALASNALVLEPPAVTVRPSDAPAADSSSCTSSSSSSAAGRGRGDGGGVELASSFSAAPIRESGKGRGDAGARSVTGVADSLVVVIPSAMAASVDTAVRGGGYFGAREQGSATRLSPMVSPDQSGGQKSSSTRSSPSVGSVKQD